MVPSVKWTRNNVSGFVAAVLVAAGLHLFDTPVDGYEEEAGLAAGWLVGAVWSFFATEKRPPPSSYPYLPPEVSPPRR